MSEWKRRGQRPIEGSLMGRIFQFLETNPDEFLTFDDVVARFDCTRDQAKTALMHLRERGFVQTGPCVWLDPERPRA